TLLFIIIIIILNSPTGKPKALLKADVRDIPVGGSVTLVCSVNQSSGWEYFWYSDKKSSEPLSTKDAAFRSNGRISVSEGGLYWCSGGRGTFVYYTEDSDPVQIRRNETKAVLTVSPSWLTPEASVTLSCKVEHPSTGWRFYWYKAVPDLSGNSYRYELLPGSTSGTEQDSYIVHGQTQTAGYACRAGKGEPVYYTGYSESKFVWSGDLHSAASLTVDPNTVQHFLSDSVSLSCGGNSSEGRVSMFTEDSVLQHCPGWRTMNGSTRIVHKIQYGKTVYWCESDSAFSNAVNITGQYDDGIILVSPVHPVTEGDSVTLGCKLRTENVLSDVLFYKNGERVQNDSRGEMSIPAVSKSDEGFYKCQYSEKESAQSWMAVKCSGSESSSLAVPSIIALICGILLIMILLSLLLYCYRKSKGETFSSQ
uniref:Ig-like domain-containing protein n=1 Tax=Stegastes partitus TaxID=144197 RepID=A0A3B5AD00_9TELE